MKKILVWVALVLLVVGGAVAVVWPVEHWRLYDANQKPLALTERENYCAGLVGLETGFKEESDKALDCLETNTKDNTTPSIAKSTGWACDGILNGGWGGTHEFCLEIFEINEYWLLATGGLTFEWNDAHPRPKAIDEGVIVDDEPTRENRSSGVVPDYTNTGEEEQDE
jgi:hypothetical protein